MSFRDAVRVMLGITEPLDDANNGRMNLQDLGFDWLNTNDWMAVRIMASRSGTPTEAGPQTLPGSWLTAHDKPLAWLSDDYGDHTRQWYAAAAEFAESGLWPIAVGGLEDSLTQADALARPWRSGDWPDHSAHSR